MDEDPWLPFRVAEPKPEPGTYPPRELWKEFQAARPAEPAWQPLPNIEPYGTEIPAADEQDRWSVPLTEAIAGFLAPHDAPVADSRAGKRLTLICSYLQGTANGLRSCNGMYTEEWLAKRWAYLWNSSAQTLRISLSHNSYDEFDPIRIFLRYVAEIGYMLDRVTGVTCLRPCEVDALHAGILDALSYQHDPTDLRYLSLSKLHYVLYWTKVSMWQEFDYATGRRTAGSF